MPRSARSRDRRKDRRRLERGHPNLRAGFYRITSESDERYNCIAYAADVDSEWWWPMRGPGVYWPPGVPLEMTLDAFVEAFITLGYQECIDGDLESGYEKVAVYARQQVDGKLKPRHMAWQSKNGKWKSKLGDEEDIVHDTLESLEGGEWGTVQKILKRRRRARYVR